MKNASTFITFFLICLLLSIHSVNISKSETVNSSDCWVILKENYEWVHEDEEMVKMHSTESNLTYDSQCRLVEKTDTSYDSLHHEFTAYNEESSISNTSLYWYDSDGDIIYLWEETFVYQNGVLTASTWAEFSYYDGNYSLNQEQHTVYNYDSQGREILTNTSHGESSYTVATTYDENGNMAKVNSSTNDELRTTIEYEYDADNVLTSETLTEYYTSSQFSKTTNYSYDGSGKLVFKEQYDGPNNWTIYWNFSYDDKGNNIVEEFNRVGSSPWATITTFTWGYGTELINENKSTTDLDDDNSLNMWLIMILIVIFISICYTIYSNKKTNILKKLIGVATEEIAEDILEEE